MRKLLIVLFIIVSFLFVGTAQATSGYKSGNDLVKFMPAFDKVITGETPQTTQIKMDAMSFTYYVLGVIDGLALSVPEGGRDYIPDGVSMGQLCAVVSKYLKAHPEQWNRQAAALVITAIVEAFPKEKGKISK